MNIPQDFSFTQSNLHDYIDCRKRFYLRYIEKLQWPSVQSEPVIAYEKQMENGQRFHQLVHQYTLGIPASLLRSLVIDEPELLRWWDNFYEYHPMDELPGERRSEFLITVPFAEYRLSAILDLIVWDGSTSCTIIDWKTATRRPTRHFLGSRIQTNLYAHIAKQLMRQQGSSILSKRFDLNFIYWFPEFPTNPENFVCTEEEDAIFSQRLHGLVAEIEASRHYDFVMTDDHRICRYCTYRSYCDRGVIAGDFSDNVGALDELPLAEESWGMDASDLP